MVINPGLNKQCLSLCFVFCRSGGHSTTLAALYRRTSCTRWKMALWPLRQVIWASVSSRSMPVFRSGGSCETECCKFLHTVMYTLRAPQGTIVADDCMIGSNSHLLFSHVNTSKCMQDGWYCCRIMVHFWLSRRPPSRVCFCWNDSLLCLKKNICSVFHQLCMPPGPPATHCSWDLSCLTSTSYYIALHVMIIPSLA